MINICRMNFIDLSFLRWISLTQSISLRIPLHFKYKPQQMRASKGYRFVTIQLINNLFYSVNRKHTYHIHKHKHIYNIQNEQIIPSQFGDNHFFDDFSRERNI